jgi:predicted DNA-binding ribbon-helix-helix protein
MAMGKRKRGRPPKEKGTRASVSFSNVAYEALERIAGEKKVSVAWVVREAVERYLSDRWPLFAEQLSRQ